MNKLYIMAGVPGCGKSTWARNLANLDNFLVVSSDEIRKDLFKSLRVAHDQDKQANNSRVFAHFHLRIEEGLRHGRDVIADATSLNRQAREKLRNVATAAEAECHLILFKNLQQALERNKNRSADAVVPEAAMEHMVRKYWDTLAELPQEHYASVTKIESVQ